MKNIFSLIALILCASILLSGCGGAAEAGKNNTYDMSNNADETASPSPSAESQISSETADNSGSDDNSETEISENTVSLDYDALYASHNPSEVVYTYCGYEVTWEQFFAWLYSFAVQIEMYYGSDIDWSSDFMEGYSFAEYGKSYAESYVNQYLSLRYGASQLGYEHNEDTRAAAEQRIQEDADYYYEGDVEALMADIESMYMSREYYLEMYEDTELYYTVFNDYYGENGSKLLVSELNDFLEKNEYMHAKHILFKTIDDNGDALSDDDKAAQKSKAEEVLSQLKVLSGLALADKFDELMTEYSEDPGYVSYPNGYYFTAGEMVESFENAAKELKTGQLSGIIESEYGYHIMYRPEISAGDLFYYDSNYNSYTLAHFVAMEKFAELQSNWAVGEQVIYSDAFDSLDFADLINSAKTE